MQEPRAEAVRTAAAELPPLLSPEQCRAIADYMRAVKPPALWSMDEVVYVVVTAVLALVDSQLPTLT